MGPMAIDGTATDNTGVTGVKYSVQHQRSAQWWTGSAWSTTQTWFNATRRQPGCHQHRLERVVHASERRSLLHLRGCDRRLGATRTRRRPTPTSPPSWPSPDTTPANGTITTPKANQVLPLGQLTFTGRATDDTGVGWADVAIQNRDTGLWWNDVSDVWGPFTWNNGESTPATRWASPTAWSYAYDPPAAGNYRVGVRARDNDGRVDATPAWVNFSVAAVLNEEPARNSPVDGSRPGARGPTLLPGHPSPGRLFSWLAHSPRSRLWHWRRSSCSAQRPRPPAGRRPAAPPAKVTVTIKAEGTDLSGSEERRNRPSCAAERTVIVFRQQGARGGGNDERFAMDTTDKQNGKWVWSTGNTGTEGSSTRRSGRSRAARRTPARRSARPATPEAAPLRRR